MRLIRYIDARMRIIAPVVALVLMIDFVLINMLLQFNDPSWWSDGKPENLNIYTSLIDISAIAFAIYIWLIVAGFLKKYNFVLRFTCSVCLLPGIMVTIYHIVPFYVTAYDGVFYLVYFTIASLISGLFLQFLQLHALLWGWDWLSVPEPTAAAHATITMTYLFFSGLICYGWLIYS